VINILKTEPASIKIVDYNRKLIFLVDRGGRDMWHEWGRGEVFTEFWLGGPKVRDHWEDLGLGGG
jgi:hypothetical protein